MLLHYYTKIRFPLYEQLNLDNGYTGVSAFLVKHVQLSTK